MPERQSIARILGSPQRNMALAGNFSFEAIKGLGNPVPMLVTNDGPELLEVWLEPFGQDYWLQPGETVVVTSYGHWDDWPFETIHEPNCLTVWATSFFATVTDNEGNEFPGGRARNASK